MKIDTITWTVAVDGQLATEYDVQGSDLSKMKTCHIVAEESKPFSITIDLTSDPQNMNKKFRYDIYIDGEKSGSYYANVGSNFFVPHAITTTSVRTPNSGGMFERRPFKFGRCLTVETSNGDTEDRAEVLQEIGTFKIEVMACQLTKENGALPYKAPVTNASAAPEVKPKAIHEKQLKGRSVPYRASLGAASYNSPPTFSTVPDQSTKRTFLFKYSSKESLMNQGIIPRPDDEEVNVDSDDSTSDDDGDELANLTIEEMRRELRRELRRRKAAENDTPDEDLPHKVKKEKVKQEADIEQQGRRRPLIPKGHTETIDLTED